MSKPESPDIRRQVTVLKDRLAVRRAISLEIPLADGSKLKTPNKDAPLSDVGKHLGVFEQDNRQKRNDIKVVIQLVG